MKWLFLYFVAIFVQADFIETSFEAIEADARLVSQLVVFYRGASTELMKAATKASNKLSVEFPEVAFRKCDGDRPENKAAFAKAGFGKGAFVFTAMPEEGIVKYSGPRSAKRLVSLVRSKYLPGRAADLMSFSDEDTFWDLMDQRQAPLPVVVMFTDKWCKKACQRVQPGFQVAATSYQDRALFMVVSCSDGDDAKEFCTHQDLQDEYPAIVMFTGEEKVRLEIKPGVVVPSFLMYTHFLESHGVRALEPAHRGALKNKGDKNPLPQTATTDSDSSSDPRTTAAATSEAGDSACQTANAELKARVVALETMVETLEGQLQGGGSRAKRALETVQQMKHQITALTA